MNPASFPKNVAVKTLSQVIINIRAVVHKIFNQFREKPDRVAVSQIYEQFRINFLTCHFYAGDEVGFVTFNGNGKWCEFFISFSESFIIAVNCNFFADVINFNRMIFKKLITDDPIDRNPDMRRKINAFIQNYKNGVLEIFIIFADIHNIVVGS